MRYEQPPPRGMWETETQTWIMRKYGYHIKCLVRAAMFLRMVWIKTVWSSTNRNGRETYWIITSNPSQISTPKHEANGHQPVSSSLGAQRVHSEGDGAPSSPSWVVRSHILGRSQLSGIRCSCIVVVPPPTHPPKMAQWNDCVLYWGLPFLKINKQKFP